MSLVPSPSKGKALSSPNPNLGFGEGSSRQCEEGIISSLRTRRNSLQKRLVTTQQLVKQKEVELEKCRKKLSMLKDTTRLGERFQEMNRIADSNNDEIADKIEDLVIEFSSLQTRLDTKETSINKYLQELDECNTMNQMLMHRLIGSF